MVSDYNYFLNRIQNLKITALAGGVGGARLANGLAQIIDPPARLTVIVNTGDDFEHLGLRISPDVDTVCYTLAGLSNPVTGWGLKNETWEFLDVIRRQGLPDWFNIGDKDRQTHLERTRRLQNGETLTQVTQALCQQWGIQPLVLPMSDDPVPTIVDTVEHGKLGFQQYFVKHRCAPAVKGFAFPGHAAARATQQVLDAIHQADLIVFCPSNPWVSLDPILMLSGVREALRGQQIIAVSPIIGGKAVKGPVAKMYAELGIEPSAVSVAAHYRDLLTGFVIDQMDEPLRGQICGMGIACLCTDTLMPDAGRQAQLAARILDFAQQMKEGAACRCGG
jgi:LPPG:FO 2-phospho-L-lactate transferase